LVSMLPITPPGGAKTAPLGPLPRMSALLYAPCVLLAQSSPSPGRPLVLSVNQATLRSLRVIKRVRSAILERTLYPVVPQCVLTVHLVSPLMRLVAALPVATVPRAIINLRLDNLGAKSALTTRTRTKQVRHSVLTVLLGSVLPTSGHLIRLLIFHIVDIHPLEHQALRPRRSPLLNRRVHLPILLALLLPSLPPYPQRLSLPAVQPLRRRQPKRAEAHYLTLIWLVLLGRTQ